jgi:hypothetical protein
MKLTRQRYEFDADTDSGYSHMLLGIDSVHALGG